MTLADAAARERIRTDIDRSFVVEAAAGTGKTSELLRRIVAVLASGRGSVESVVAVTFTEKAAGELKLRLRIDLDRERQRASAGSAERARLEAALARMEEARVSTIHGFCADLLRERPVEARVDPLFRVLTEPESRRLFAAELGRWLQGKLEDPPEGVRRAMRRSSFAAGGPSGRLEQAAWTLAEWRDFRTPWQRAAFDRDAAIAALVPQLAAFAELSERCSSPHGDPLHNDTEPARRLRLEIESNESVRGRDNDALEGALIALLEARASLRAGSDRPGGWRPRFRAPRQGRGKWYGRGLERDEVLAAHESLCAGLEDFAARADADLAPLLQGELLEVVERYEERKRRAGCVDFLDLLLRARDLVRGCDEVRHELQRRFTHLFVDEFQDTDPLQAEILLLLAAADPAVRDWRLAAPVPGKLFIVGDPKQSIYRFRRADVGIYLEVRDLLAANGAECLELTTSFRAVPSIQKLVNASFGPSMTGDSKKLQAAYVPLTPWRGDAETQPAVVVLPVPRPVGWKTVTQKAIEESLPDATGAFVDWLIRDSGWTVTERDRPGERVRIEARHICLLFRRFDHFFKPSGDATHDYVQALEARAIPHLLVGGGSYHGREEVESVRAALCAIEWPDDELSVFATLHGSFFAISDEELFEYRHHFKRLHPFRHQETPPHLVRIREALDVLAELHRRRNRRTVAETIASLLETTRAHAGFVLRPSGEQVLANVLHVAELARAYESAGGISFRGFVQQLMDEADGGKAAEAPILEEGSDGVRLMTVHKAKGLEFPVVILADLTCHLSRQTASRWVDPAKGLCAVRLAGWPPAELLAHEAEEIGRDEAEAVRVAYVAATRARDLLVVPAVGLEPFESSWLGPLTDGLYPRRVDGRWEAPASSQVEGCPPFGPSSLVTAAGLQGAEDGSVAPGRYDLGDGSVVWFDPNLLRLDVQPLFGIRQEELIGKDADPEVVRRDLRRHEEWLADRAAALERGGRPTVSARTATAQAALPAPALARDIEIVSLPRPAERPAGPRFGALVHAVLASIDLGAEPAAVEDAAEMHARLLGAPAEEVAAAVDAVAAALLHALLVRARDASRRGACRREVPVTLLEADGTVIDGIVDLAFAEGGAWTVVDFKTDRELSANVEVYKRQVDVYCRAITAATGEPARGVLLRL